MSDIRFPSQLKPIVNKGYSTTHGQNVWRTQLAGGAPRQARDTYYDTIPINVTLILTGWEVQAWEAFLVSTANGSVSFIMTHDLGRGLRDYLTWITSPISRTTQDGINWYISFTATVEALYDPCEEKMYETLLPLYQCYGGGLAAFLEAYGYAQSHHPRIWDPLQD